MVVGPLAGMPPFEPLQRVVPFTYRDTATNQQIVNGLRQTLNALIDEFNSANDTNTSEHNRIVSQLTTQFNNALNALDGRLTDQLDGITTDSASVNDPTTGSRNVSLSQALSNTFDNSRVFAYFAKQLDDFGWTAAEYDTLHIDTARHFDLAPTYPVLNDVLD